MNETMESKQYVIVCALSAFRIWHPQIPDTLVNSVTGNGQVVGKILDQRNQRQDKARFGNVSGVWEGSDK